MPNPQYPTLPIDPTSKRIPRDGRFEDDLGDGTLRVRQLHAPMFDFALKHANLTDAQVATLQSFYDTNSTANEIDFTWILDGLVYTVTWGRNALTIDPGVSWGYSNVTVRLVGV